MTTSPRTLVVIWTVALFFNLAALCIVIVSLITKPSHRDEWYYIVMPIILSIGACSCAYNSWRCWKLHKSDGQNFIPMPLSSQV